MEGKSFYKGEALKFGWNMIKNNLIFFIGLFIIDGLVYKVLETISNSTKETVPVFSFIIDIVSIIMQLVIQMGLIKIALRIYDKEKCELTDVFSDLLSCLPLILKYLSALILYILIVLFGLILLIVPGLVWSLKFSFFAYFIVDKELGPIEAFKKSSLITEGVKEELFLFWLLILVINLVGLLLFFVGLFLTLPITIIAIGYVYRRLLYQTEAPILAN
jgi:uncharacterized membrane protein